MDTGLPADWSCLPLGVRSSPPPIPKDVEDDIAFQLARYVPMEWSAQAAKEAAHLLASVRSAEMNSLAPLAGTLMATVPDPRVVVLVHRISRGGPGAASALDVLDLKPGLAAAEALRVFPGCITADVLGGAEGERDLMKLAPLTRLLRQLGPEACLLAMALGEASDDPTARWVGLLVGAETRLAQVAALAARRLVDREPRVAWLAAELLGRFCREDGERGDRARALIKPLADAMAGPNGPWVMGAVRAAAQIQDPVFVPALIPLVECGVAEVAEAALHALRDITGQRLPPKVARWQKYWATAAPIRRR